MSVNLDRICREENKVLLYTHFKKHASRIGNMIFYELKGKKYTSNCRKIAITYSYSSLFIFQIRNSTTDALHNFAVLRYCVLNMLQL